LAFLRKISFVLLVAVLFAPADSVRGFSDVGLDNFAYYSVQTLLKENIIDQATYYRPNANITRGDFLTMIMWARKAQDRGQELLYAHLEKKHSYADLKDVPVGSPYASAVSWGVSEDIIEGQADGLFHGDDSLNRAEASKIITYAFFGGEMQSGEVPYFSDVDAGAWYYPYLVTVASEGLLTGYRDNLGNSLGTFGPSNTLTRAEAAVILERCLAVDVVTRDADANLDFNVYARSKTYLQVDFSESLTTGSANSNYFTLRDEAGNNLKIYSAELNDSSSVVLTTDPQTPNTIYILTVSGVESTTGKLMGESEASFLGYNAEKGELTVTLNPTDATTDTLGANAAQIEFLNLELSAGLDNGITIQSLEVRRRGLGLVNEIQNIRAIYRDQNIAEKENLRSDGTVTLNFKPYIILQAGQTAQLKILADFATAQSGTTYHSMEIADAKSWGFTGNVDVTMDANLRGPQYKRVTTASAMLTYTEEAVEIDSISLNKTTTLAQVLLQAYNEDVDITKIIFENEGTLQDNCFEDVELRIGGKRVADKLDTADDDKLSFTLNKPYTLEKNSQEEMTLKSKFTCGFGDTISLWIDDKSGIEAVGTKYGYGAQIVRNADSVVVGESTVEGGTLTLDSASSNPGSLLIYANGNARTIAAFNFKSSGEDLVMEDLKFTLTTSGMKNHFFEELTFYWGGREVETFSPKNLATQTLEVSGPLELPANRSKTLSVKVKMGKILTEEEGSFQLSWNALSKDGILFDVEKAPSGEPLDRDEVSPSDALKIDGGEIQVREDI